MSVTVSTNTANTVLAWKPVFPGTVTLQLNGKSLKDDGAGNITGDTVTSGTINYSTGAISVTFGSAPSADDAFASYTYNNEYAPAEVPEMNITLESINVTAVSRKLKALWSFDAAFELQKEYGSDMNALLAAQAAAEIAHKQLVA